MKISIITATRNNEATISDCIKSYLSQDYEDKEHLVIDALSSDKTLSLIQNLSPNSLVVSEPDFGIYDALSKGIRLSTGEVVGFLHSDDFFASSNCLSAIANIFKDSSVCAVYGDLVYVSQNNLNKTVRIWKSNRFQFNYLFFGWMPPHPTLYVRKEWYETIGYFDLNYTISSDYDSVLKLFKNRKFKAVYLPSTLVCMRVGGISNKSFSSIVTKSKEDYRVLRTNHFSIFCAFFILFFKNFRKIKQYVILPSRSK